MTPDNKQQVEKTQSSLNSYSYHTQLSDGRVLSVQINPYAQSGTTYFVGTDGDGLNWGIASSLATLPKTWQIVDQEDTPALQSDHVRFMLMEDYDDRDRMLYVATYGGVSYAKYNPIKPGFGPWKTATRLEFLGDQLNPEKNHIRSIHIARADASSLDQAKLYIATDRGLWVTILNQEGEPSEWTNLGLSVASISSVYATGDKNKDIILVGTTDHGLAVGMIENEHIHWQYYDAKQGLASDHLWDVFITGKEVGDSIIIGTNGGGISWAQIENLEEGHVELSSWSTVDSKTKGFPNNCNAQLFASGNKEGDTLWVATRAGLAWAHFDKQTNLNDWQCELISDTTNDIGSVLVKDEWITLGIYGTGIAISKLDEKGNPTTWKVAHAKQNEDH